MQTVAQSNREQQRDQDAYAALIACQADGCQVEFKDREQKEFVKLWAIPGPERSEIVLEDTMHEKYTKSCDIYMPKLHDCLNFGRQKMWIAKRD